MRRKHVEIIKHHRNSSVYIDGRYMHVDSKLSMRSKRGRELAIETANAIIEAVYANTPGVKGPMPVTDDRVSPRDTSDDQV